jgi:hypothetical protein
MYLEFFFWRSRKEKNTQQNQTDNITCIILHNQIPEIDSSITLVSLTCDIPPISQNQPDCRFIDYHPNGLFVIASLIRSGEWFRR